jgi:hypothetical protein
VLEGESEANGVRITGVRQKRSRVQSYEVAVGPSGAADFSSQTARLLRGGKPDQLQYQVEVLDAVVLAAERPEVV